MRHAPVLGLTARLESGWLDVGAGYNEVPLDVAQRELRHRAPPHRLLKFERMIMRNQELFSALCAVFLAGVLPAQAQPDPRVADLVTAGKIRMGVFPSFQYAKTPAGEPQGLAWGITRAFALRLGIAENGIQTG